MNLVGAASADRGLQFSNTSAKCVSVNSKIVRTAQGTWKSLFGGDRCSPVPSSSSHSSYDGKLRDDLDLEAEVDVDMEEDVLVFAFQSAEEKDEWTSGSSEG